MTNITVDTAYDADQIDSLEGLEAVRTRPGMYIGSTSQKGVTHLVFEVVDNSVDEFMAGYGKDIYITVAKDCTVTCQDFARGIPVGIHSRIKYEDGRPMNSLTAALTKLHTGGKFNKAGSGYKVSGGLHGVGVKAANALSDRLTVIVKRGGKIYQQEFSKGEEKTGVLEIGTCEMKDTGTTIAYHPDPEIFKITLEPNCKDLQSRINEIASLNAGLRIHYKNEITKVEKTFCSEDGIIGYVKRMTADKNRLYDEPFYMKGSYELNKDKVILVEIAFMHDDEDKPSETIKTFANNINTTDGGFHFIGFRNEYRKQINDFGINSKFIAEPIESKYLLDGIHAIVSVKVPDAEFENQTKTKLGSAEAQDAVEDVMRKSFAEIIKDKEKLDILETIVVRAAKVKEAEEAARKARANARKANKTSKMALPGKLADCENRSGYSELFLVEGDSAAGSAKNGRYREFQAILPLRGKLLNTEKSDYESMIDSPAIKNIIAALGAGVGKNFDVTRVRYDKINIMTDADDDGSHIKALLLTFFYNYMPALIENGLVYVTVPPLYRVTKAGKSQYLKDDHELKEFRKKNSGKIEVDRFKGLGEMNPDQLKETTMDPATRTLKRITMGDAEKAAEIFAICMGSKAELRRDFIEANAYRVELDFA